MRVLIAAAILSISCTSAFAQTPDKSTPVNFTGHYELADTTSDRSISLDITQTGIKAAISFSAAMNDGSGAAPDGDGIGKVNKAGVLRFTFTDSFNNECSPTHREAQRVTDAIRVRLKAEGRLGEAERTFTALRPLNLTEAQRQDQQEYIPGAVVQFHQNAKGFQRGERLTITGADENGVHTIRVDGSAVVLPLEQAKRFQLYRAEQEAFAKGDSIRITQNGFTREPRRGAGKDRLNNGSVYEVDGFTRQGDIKLSNGFVLPKDYGGISHGYVVTSHASQGKTVDTVLLAVGQESFAAANKEQFYVSVSRGKSGVRIYTDDKAAMLDAVKGSAARLSASELMEGQMPRSRPRVSIMQRLFRVQQIKRAYWAVRERVEASWNVPRHREVQSHAGIER